MPSSTTHWHAQTTLGEGDRSGWVGRSGVSRLPQSNNTAAD